MTPLDAKCTRAAIWGTIEIRCLPAIAAFGSTATLWMKITEACLYSYHDNHRAPTFC